MACSEGWRADPQGVWVLRGSSPNPPWVLMLHQSRHYHQNRHYPRPAPSSAFSPRRCRSPPHAALGRLRRFPRHVNFFPLWSPGFLPMPGSCVSPGCFALVLSPRVVPGAKELLTELARLLLHPGVVPLSSEEHKS